MEVREPGGLTEVGSLAGHLKIEPLFRVIFLGEGGEGDGVFGVVLLYEVFDDGAGFEDGDVRVGVVDCGNTVVKDEFGKFLFFFWRRQERNSYRPFGLTSVYGCSLTDFPSR